MNIVPFSFQGKRVRFVGTAEKPEWVASDLVEILYPDTDKRNRSNYLSKVPANYKGKKQVNTKGGLQEVITLKLEGIRRLISTSKSLDARKLARVLGMEVITTLKEENALRVISAAFAHLKPIPQFFVLGFRIDLYFPAHKIAVECDELGHIGYSAEVELARQDVIAKALSCKFIRFNPDVTDFNVGEIINKIMVTIYECET